MSCFNCCGGCKYSFDNFEFGVMLELWGTPEWEKSANTMKEVWESKDYTEDEKKEKDCYHRKIMYHIAARISDIMDMNDDMVFYDLKDGL